jgi:CheY-like chemotaxis protein/chemotaxis signal transduction protein
MSLPHLLVVDDSEAIVAYETAALSAQYRVTTASNGREAFAKLRDSRPAAVLLDLSMPEMTGDELLARMQADPELRDIPVIVVSSERSRGEASLTRGAWAYLPKPIRAQPLRELVAQVLDEERRRSRNDELAVLFLDVGPFEMGIPLEPVRMVLSQPMTESVPNAPDYLCEMIDYRGARIFVLDLALKLAVAHQEPLQERKLVIYSLANRLLAVCVDRVRAPEVFPASLVLRRSHDRGTEQASLPDVFSAIVKSQIGAVPIIDPEVFWSADRLDRLSESLRQRAAENRVTDQ